MKSTIEIISILKRLKKDSAYKYGIKPFGFLAHLLGINRMRQVIWMYLSLFRNLIFYFGKDKRGVGETYAFQN